MTVTDNGPLRVGTLPLPEVSQERVKGALAERERVGKLSADLYTQYIDAHPKRGAALAARDRLAAFTVPPEEIEHVQAVADQLPRFRALVNQGLRGHLDADRQLDALLVREHSAFVVGAERHVAEVKRIADEELAPVLARYLAAWETAADAYRSIEKATATVIAGRDESVGTWRADNTVRTEAQVPENPLPADAVSLIRTVLPRPRIYTTN
ncbi:MAG TPA: hypothetical protein VG294_00410 [Solirubrobacteraceae bacterium]|jgi:hypothetical protein|nr:hypothetical protein [Solirubrobacteraceae bacterium]